MGKHSNEPSPPDRQRRKPISESDPDPDSNSDSEQEEKQVTRKSKTSSSSRRSSSKDRKSSSKRKRSRDSDSSSEYDDSESESDDSDSRRRRRKERKRKEEKREIRRREKEKEKKRRRKRKEDEKRKKKEKKKKGAVTDTWGKYGLIKETDMWNKRPEFTAWLAEVKKVNLESLPTWEEKQLFKDFMEDHNTATFPSKKYYNLDTYYERKMVKEMKKGISKVQERTVFDDEEQRRLELQRERERHKEEQVEALKRSMQGGMAQAMKEQAQLKEEMAYQYKLGNFEAAAAIQRRLDPDIV